MAANIAIVNALALLVGPIVGGAIAANTTWRWIFIIKYVRTRPKKTRLIAGNSTDLFYDSVPIAAIAFLISILAIPNGFPHHGQTSRWATTTADNHNAKTRYGRLDIPGTILILLAVLGLTAAFEEADKLFPWRSAYVITLLTVSGILWILLILWERHVTLSNGIREPVLSWNFLTNRQMVGILL